MSENIEYENIVQFIENDVLNTRLINNSMIEGTELDGGSSLIPDTVKSFRDSFTKTVENARKSISSGFGLFNTITSSFEQLGEIIAAPFPPLNTDEESEPNDNSVGTRLLKKLNDLCINYSSFGSILTVIVYIIWRGCKNGK
jgi:hypothetical protein